jgi:hypothetical protein
LRIHESFFNSGFNGHDINSQRPQEAHTDLIIATSAVGHPHGLENMSLSIKVELYLEQNSTSSRLSRFVAAFFPSFLGRTVVLRCVLILFSTYVSTTPIYDT